MITDGGNNLQFPDATCGAGIPMADPLLGPLRDNGGPTLTHALLPDSPAIDAANPAFCPAGDQRGVTRPQGVGCDIGAFEVQVGAVGATLIVNTTDDELNNDGDCSLREAITAANTNTAVDACIPGMGADTINFNVTIPVVIMLGSTLPDISDDLSIAGLGADNLTISGNNAVRVFLVNPGITLNLQDLTVATGSAEHSDSEPGGGGIDNAGTLEITNSTFSGNDAVDQGGAINNNGALTIRGSTFSGNRACDDSGGAIDNSGMLLVMDSTFSSNEHCASGGGISNSGTLEITNSTFSGNSTGQSGGGILNGGTLIVTNSTFSGNSAFSGGGISNSSGTTPLRNTIVANSPSGGNCAGTITDGGNNLQFPDATCGASIPTADPLLGPLADNGGPTLTHALQPGSPALDAANPAFCPATDQRGATRPQAARGEMGAV